MILQQSKKPISLFETILNNYTMLQRCFIFTCAFLVLGVVVAAEKENIVSFFFSNLPSGLGLTGDAILLFAVVTILALSSAIYFGIISVTKVKSSSIPDEVDVGFLSELRISLVFGACFGLLTAILCSLIFVIAEPYLPQSFLAYHQIFSSLDVPLILLTSVFLSALYLGIFMLPLSLFLIRLSENENRWSQFKLTTCIIGLSSLLVALFVAFSIVTITSVFSINVIIFSIIISMITSGMLGLLYWLVGVEASLIANVVYCLIVSYLAHIFL